MAMEELLSQQEGERGAGGGDPTERDLMNRVVQLEKELREREGVIGDLRERGASPSSAAANEARVLRQENEDLRVRERGRVGGRRKEGGGREGGRMVGSNLREGGREEEGEKGKEGRRMVWYELSEGEGGRGRGGQWERVGEREGGREKGGRNLEKEMVTSTH